MVKIVKNTIAVSAMTVPAMSEIEKRLLAVRDDRSRGANQLAGDALALLGAAALAAPGRGSGEIIAEAHGLAARLMTLRPSMAAIGNWSLLWWRVLRARPGAAAALTTELGERRQAVAAAVTESAVQALGQARSVLTLSYSSTVEAVLVRAPTVERVVIGEGRPRLEGRRLAQALHGRIARVELITDAQLAHFAARVDHVLLGADSICADGCAVNKVGSLAAALGAQAAGVPCLIAADSFKLDPHHIAATIPLEEMAPEEVWAERPEGCRNIYFEPVPAHLIAAYATEKGVLNAARLASEIFRWRHLHAHFQACAAA
jgi:ribose 1,5-bisphosphate isomerase